jgi:hypothetical protein
MTCPAFEYSPRGRQGIGVIQPQSGLDYPLVSPSADIRYLLADMYFAYDDPALYDTNLEPVKHPLRIAELHGVGCEDEASESSDSTPHAADIVIVDDNDNVVFDSSDLGDNLGYQRFSTVAWGDDYTIYEWLSPTAVCRIVVHKTWPPAEDAPINYATNLVPENAVIDERAVYRMPKRVLSLTVLNTTVRRSDVIFRAGYNSRLAAGATAVAQNRNRTEILYDVFPGAGFGQYSDCLEEKPKYLYNINGVGPNPQGDFFLAGPSCVFVRTPTALADGGVTKAGNTTLMIGANCEPCCDCDDYIETATYMNRVQKSYKRVGARTHQVKLQHEANIVRWVEQLRCRMNRPLRLKLVPQSCPYMEVVMQFCNHCPECLEDIDLDIEFTSPLSAGVAVVPGRTTLTKPGVPTEPVTLNGGWPIYNVRVGSLDKGASAVVRFMLRFEPKAAHIVRGILTGTIGGAPIKPCDPEYGNDEVSEDIDSRALYCVGDC